MSSDLWGQRFPPPVLNWLLRFFSVSEAARVSRVSKSWSRLDSEMFWRSSYNFDYGAPGGDPVSDKAAGDEHFWLNKYRDRHLTEANWRSLRCVPREVTLSWPGECDFALASLTSDATAHLEPDLDLIALSDATAAVRVFDATAGRCLLELSGVKARCVRLAAGPKGQPVLFVAEESKPDVLLFRVPDVRGGRCQAAVATTAIESKGDSKDGGGADSKSESKQSSSDASFPERPDVSQAPRYKPSEQTPPFVNGLAYSAAHNLCVASYQPTSRMLLAPTTGQPTGGRTALQAWAGERALWRVPTNSAAGGLAIDAATGNVLVLQSNEPNRCHPRYVALFDGRSGDALLHTQNTCSLPVSMRHVPSRSRRVARPRVMIVDDASIRNPQLELLPLDAVLDGKCKPLQHFPIAHKLGSCVRAACDERKLGLQLQSGSLEVWEITARSLFRCGLSPPPPRRSKDGLFGSAFARVLACEIMGDAARYVCVGQRGWEKETAQLVIAVRDFSPAAVAAAEAAAKAAAAAKPKSESSATATAAAASGSAAGGGETKKQL